jgi:hypothetical protein
MARVLSAKLRARLDAAREREAAEPKRVGSTKPSAATLKKLAAVRAKAKR